jgi:hypothetical protein
MCRNKPRRLRWKKTSEGCLVPLSHKLKPNGYFQYRVGKTMKYFHRYIWELKYGTIPYGYEVDHLCRNRACGNIKHLQVLSKKEHVSKSHDERYEYSRYWQRIGLKLLETYSILEVSKMFNLTPGAVRYWNRRKNEAH